MRMHIQTARTEQHEGMPLQRLAIVVTALATMLLLLASTVSAQPPDGAGSDFPTWNQLFNHNTEGWIGNEVSGPEGWCGTIERVPRAEGEVSPPAGRAYAVVSEGPCNEFYQSVGFLTSGPFAPGAGFSTMWHPPGFVYELDIYLDPQWDIDTGFILAASFNQPALPFPEGFRYFFVPVFVTEDGVLTVNGEHEITAAGWYKFRYVFGSDGDQLTAEYQLHKGGEIYSANLTTTALSGESISSFNVEDVGTGYLWFVTISDGLELPIDQHRVHRGR